MKYKSGTLEAFGYKDGKKIITDKVQTTEEAVSVQLSANKILIDANREDIAVLTVNAIDKNNQLVPTANNEITFSIEGPGKTIGVGNGNPTSLEPDKYIETIQVAPIENLKEKIANSFNNLVETRIYYDDLQWNAAFKEVRDKKFAIQARIFYL